MSVTLFIAFIVLGAVSGMLAGLFGIGGGMVIVPALVYLLPKMGIPDQLIMSMALGISFSTIVVNTFSAAQHHHKFGNIDFSVAKFFIPPLMIMGFLTTSIVTGLPKHIITKAFAILMLYLSIKMFLSIKKSQKVTKELTKSSMIIAGGTIGVLASIGGIAGGGFTVPFLENRGLPLKKAIGTSALCGCLLGLTGMFSFIFHGYNAPNLPDYSLGYVYLPALLCIVSISFFTSKLGARLTTKLPVSILKKAFALLLIGIAINMFFKY
ncbi:sulfite exporter TauE/SafE family protein [Pasteurella atlantica]|uniref:Sulfite exporter TauE/SafE family protein n=3 Tax=Pasteurellaceae TaxID=712 RepID=A0ACC6HNZ2_9PAST|nr:sulfite exporter TauE/SafE family protein [Pasteurella atlantica]MBR0573292.1 sulfite exporter TauE/SafE family protein [Pasteurella atlantica]MDP8034481.1 sulfite exporter TauE/SafE family protein [Pasteurella atlantica]MDP8036405.1 sulfite exporter TauE/SafE family protein [Pasteurella atlantica]MDP8038358.1 sulfite exporter TauE/SafE family protein [Pasteurella atlantica]MDP8040156.1 sulfite exporter TauE/SafE family protein [Pasteurella atlantica]